MIIAFVTSVTQVARYRSNDSLKPGVKTTQKHTYWNKITFQSKADHPRTIYTDTFFAPVTSIMTWWPWHTKLDLDIPNVYLHTKMN